MSIDIFLPYGVQEHMPGVSTEEGLSYKVILEMSVEKDPKARQLLYPDAVALMVQKLFQGLQCKRWVVLCFTPGGLLVSASTFQTSQTVDDTCLVHIEPDYVSLVFEKVVPNMVMFQHQSETVW